MNEEPVQLLSFNEMIKGLKEGKKFTRLNVAWAEKQCHMVKNIVVVSNGFWVNMSFHLEDFEANDWIEEK